MPAFRASIHVHPGARADAVGGRAPVTRPDGRPTLSVAVRARPVRGAATSAAERAVATALGVRRQQVRVVRGARGRTKQVEIADPPADVAQRWAALLDG